MIGNLVCVFLALNTNLVNLIVNTAVAARFDLFFCGFEPFNKFDQHGLCKRTVFIAAEKIGVNGFDQGMIFFLQFWCLISLGKNRVPKDIFGDPCLGNLSGS